MNGWILCRHKHPAAAASPESAALFFGAWYKCAGRWGSHETEAGSHWDCCVNFLDCGAKRESKRKVKPRRDLHLKDSWAGGNQCRPLRVYVWHSLNYSTIKLISTFSPWSPNCSEMFSVFRLFSWDELHLELWPGTASAEPVHKQAETVFTWLLPAAAALPRTVKVHCTIRSDQRQNILGPSPGGFSTSNLELSQTCSVGHDEV